MLSFSLGPEFNQGACKASLRGFILLNFLYYGIRDKMVSDNHDNREIMCKINYM